MPDNIVITCIFMGSPSQGRSNVSSYNLANLSLAEVPVGALLIDE
jgi:hypothetical protein